MNRLAGATSPYLLQHAENPVDWYEWGDEAFARARAEDKPLLVSVGYSSCHWCHVMAHESFESATTAALMNDLFVNVKVDREERPDVDAVTMEATVGMTGSGGWPTTVFMTPDAKAFYAGTYFPPEPRHGIPSFPELLRAIADTWRERREDIEQQAARIDGALRSTAGSEASTEPLTSSLLAEAERGIASTFERAFGGFGRAPKFPAASTLEFLLRRGDEGSLAMVTATLDGMAAGGFYDVVGGGFHRYSVDDRWLVPHFEKMLYDNAVLVSTYLHAWVVTGRERYREVVEETLGYMLRELALAGRRVRVRARRRHRRRGGADVHVDAGGGSGRRTPERAARGVRARTLRRPWRARAGAPAGRPRRTRYAAAAVPRRQGARLVERPRAGGARRGGLPARARGLARRGSAARRVPPRPALRGGRTPAALDPRRTHERVRVPRRLRERRARAHGAPRRDGRAPLAARGAAARAPRRRALRRRRARRLLPLARRRRRARPAHEGPPGHADPVGELDARVRAVAARADLGRRRARAARSLGVPASRSLRCAVLPASSPGCSAGSISGSARRASSRSSATSRRRSRVPRLRRFSRERSSRSARPRRCRCSQARVPSRGSLRSTSASASSAAPRSPNRRRSSPDADLSHDRGAGGRHLGRLGALARLTEEHGLEGLFRSDHYTAIIRPDAAAHDAWATLAGLAAVTERIRLGTMVSPATFRHPSVLARMAVTVDHISGGRVEVGMGSGWYEREHLAHGFPFLTGKAAVRALRRAGRGRRPLVDGGALRPRRAVVHAAGSAGAPAACPEAAPAARPRRHGEAAVRRARRALCDRGEHARRARTRSCASGRRASTARAPRSGAIPRRSATRS